MADRKPAPPTPPDERDAEWECCHLYALTDEIGMCGCGWPGDAYNLIRELLAHFHDRDDRDAVQMIGSTGAAQIVLYRLQDVDLIDHGTSSASSWITDKGRYALWLMRRHPYADVDDRGGFPDCQDHETGRCPDECWALPADVPPEPARPTMDELLAEAKREADEIRSRMSPAERAMCDQVDAQMTSMMLWGTPVPPTGLPPSKFTGFAGLLDDMTALTPLVKPDRDAPSPDDAAFRPMLPPMSVGDPVWDQMLYGPPAASPPGPAVTGLFDALGGVVPGSPPQSVFGPLDRTLDWVLRTDEAANGPLGRAKWAPVGCICPWPWPTGGGHVRLDCPHYAVAPRPVVGTNPYTECRRVDGTWVHGGPEHTCPRWVRG